MTNSDIDADIEFFLVLGLKNMSRKLGEAVILQFGGSEEFINKSKAASINIESGITGWISSVDMVDFYNDNKKEILDYAKAQVAHCGYSSVGALLQTQDSLIRNVLTEVEVVEGLYDEDYEQHKQVAVAMSYYIGAETAMYYIKYMQEQEC